MQVQSLKDRETIMEDTQNSIPAKKYDFFYELNTLKNANILNQRSRRIFTHFVYLVPLLFFFTV